MVLTSSRQVDGATLLGQPPLRGRGSMKVRWRCAPRPCGGS